MNSWLDHMGRPRIVITGLGAVTPVGNTVAESWANIINGRSGIDRITQFNTDKIPCKIAGEVKGFNPADYIPHKEVRRMSRASHLAVAAARQALLDAGFGDQVPDPERAGTCLGTGLGGYEKADDSYTVFKEKGLAKVTPFALISSLPNMPCHHVSVAAQTLGPITTVVTACASGTQALGEAAEYIRRGRADLMVAGGVEGLIHEAALAGFAAMRAMAVDYNDDPTRASRPFNLDRSGFILSEGCAIFILERLDKALERGAKIYAELLGHASSSDAFHVAALDPDAAGAVRCMRWALEDAGVAPTQVNYINAHGTSTPANDVTETNAIKKLFEEHAYKLAVSSTKSLTGHALGGAGALEALFTVGAIEHNLLPPTCNYEIPDPECDLDYVPNVARPAEVEVALSNSFGLGGQNACVVLGKYKG